MNMKKYLIGLSAILISHISQAGGFCDNQGGKHTIEYILLFQNKAYLTISPGFSSGGEAESCSRTETSLNLSTETGNQYYSTALAAFASGKKVQISYCGPCIPHGYHGSSVQVTQIEGLTIYK